jgi:hypothetical protein
MQNRFTPKTHKITTNFEISIEMKVRLMIYVFEDCKTRQKATKETLHPNASSENLDIKRDDWWTKANRKFHPLVQGQIQ